MKNNLKKVSVLLMVALLAMTTVLAQGSKEDAKAAEAAPVQEERVYVDALGRENTLPYPIEKIAPSGNPTQILLYAVCPEKMVGLGSSYNEAAAPYILDYVEDLPVFGAFYGRKANLNMEALIMASPEVVFDVGEIKKNMKEDLDALQAQIGIPVVFIEGYLQNIGDTLREIGKVTGNVEEGEKLGAYADKVIADVNERRAQVTDPVKVYYAGFGPLDGYAKGSFHTEVLDLVGCENVVPETFTSKGGNKINMEQMLIWNPEVILIQDKAAYDEILTDEKWASIDAVQNGRVYLVPSYPYSFLTQPPAINRIIGIYWLGQLVYPELYADIDLDAEVKEFYSLFYHYELSDKELDEILNR